MAPCSPAQLSDLVAQLLDRAPARTEDVLALVAAWTTKVSDTELPREDGDQDGTVWSPRAAGSSASWCRAGSSASWRSSVGAAPAGAAGAASSTSRTPDAPVSGRAGSRASWCSSAGAAPAGAAPAAVAGAASSTRTTGASVPGTTHSGAPTLKQQNLYCVTNGPAPRRHLLGIWTASWEELCRHLEISSLAGSGFHLKKFGNMTEAEAYWTAKGWRGAAPLHSVGHGAAAASSLP